MKKDLRGVPLYFILKGSVQGNFQRYEFLKKKIFAASLQRHKATHSDTEKSFTCDVCDKKFTRLEYLHNHYHDTVLSPNEFQCPNCEKSFVFKSGKYRIVSDTPLFPCRFLYTTTTTTQSSPRTSSSALTARNRSCLRVVSIRYTIVMFPSYFLYTTTASIRISLSLTQPQPHSSQTTCSK